MPENRVVRLLLIGIIVFFASLVVQRLSSSPSRTTPSPNICWETINGERLAVDC